jgi:hypothetical protein
MCVCVCVCAAAACLADTDLPAASPRTQMLIRNQNLTPEQSHLVESKAIYNCVLGADNMEGIMSFLEKRPPQFARLAMDRLDAGGWAGPKSKL